MKLLEEYVQTEFGNRWMTYDSEAFKTGRKKYSEKGDVLAIEISYRKHPFFLNWLGREQKRWIPAEFLREVEIK